ncbi:Cell division protein DivIB [compost metagenome]
MHKAQIPALRESRPKRNTSRKIAWTLIILFLVLLAVLFFRSSLSQITEVQFQGSTFTPQDKLLEQSGLEIGGQFFGASKEEIIGRMKQIHSIQTVMVDKHFPGKISIQIKEYPTVAYEVNADGELRAILSNGTSVEVSSSGIAVEKPILTQWKSDDPIKVKLSQALANIPSEWTADISEILPDPTPSFPDRIRMYTRSQFEVLTAVSLLEKKISYLNQVIETEEPGMITMFQADTYVPFKPREEDGSLENATTQ